MRMLMAAMAAVVLVLGGWAQPAHAIDGFSLETIGGHGYGVVGDTAQVIQVATAFLTYPEQTITLDASGLPAGATWHFDPPRVTAGGSAWLYVFTPAGTPPGTHPVTVIGVGETTVTTRFQFVV